MESLKILHGMSEQRIASSIDQNGILKLDLEELDAYDNTKIYDVSFMKNLKILNAGGNCIIGQDSISNLNLIQLNVCNNPKIINVTFMKKY